MIGWLKGEKICTWNNGSRTGLILSCSGVGYEIQVLTRNLTSINDSKEVTLWIHQIQREDGSFLIGFIEKADRDLFRKLISVSGIGTQSAIALLENQDANKLVDVITQKKIDHLIKSPGIGKRTAERLVVELHNKLLDFPTNTAFKTKATESYQETNLNIDIANEVKSALINLDYKETEIENAFREYEKNESSKSTKTPGEGGVPQILDFETLFKQSLIIINTDTR